MRERALAFHDHPVRPLGRVADHDLGGAGDEVRHDGVDRDPAAGDRDARLAGGDELRAFARAAERGGDLERGGHLADRRVGPDREDDSRARPWAAVAADRQVGRRLAELAHPRTAAFRGRGQLGIGEHALVQSIPDGHAALERDRQRGAVRIRDPPAGRGRSDEQGRRAPRERVFDRGDDRNAPTDADAVSGIPSRTGRVDDRDDLEGRVPEDSDGGLRGGGRELTLGEDRDLHRPPRSAPSRRKRPCRPRVVSPDASASPPFTITCSIPTGYRWGSS